MSFIQGTRVRLRADFRDHETGLATDPTEVILTVRDPAGAIVQYTLSDAQVVNDPDRVGRFYFDLDTAPAAGTWEYQFESTGNEATVGRKKITVTSKLVAA